MKQSNGWQACPKCQGQGVVWFPTNQPWSKTFLSNGEPYTCDVCNGMKIININSGLPPDLPPEPISETYSKC